MSYEPDFGGVHVSRIRKPFTQFLKKDASSSIYNRSTSTYKSIRGYGVTCATIDGQKRYVMAVTNLTFYENTSSSPMTQTLFYSNNGKDWLECANNLLNYSANGVVWCSYLNKFFACGIGKLGNTRTMVASSSDGITWSPAYSQNVPSPFGFITIASSGDKIVIGNGNMDGNLMYYSLDGTTWLDTNTMIEGTCQVVAWGNNIWTAVVDNTKLYWSADGITWSTEGQEFGVIINSLKYDGTIWAAVGLSNGQSSVLVSDDGKTWNYRGDNTRLGILGYNDVEWLAMGINQQGILNMQRSVDKGLTWTIIEPAIYFFGASVLWDGEKWVIIGQGYSGTSTSPLVIYQDTASGLWTTHDLPDQTKCDYFLQEKQVRAYENDMSFGTL